MFPDIPEQNLKFVYTLSKEDVCLVSGCILTGSSWSHCYLFSVQLISVMNEVVANNRSMMMNSRVTNWPSVSLHFTRD